MEPPVFPLDEVERMTDIERLSIARIDAECMNLLQAIKIIDLEIDQLRRKYNDETNTKQTQRIQYIEAFNAKKKEQVQTVKDIAEHYCLDPEKMTYDPDTGVLRDLRKEN